MPQDPRHYNHHEKTVVILFSRVLFYSCVGMSDYIARTCPIFSVLRLLSFI
jgi:hypothetical protein